MEIKTNQEIYDEIEKGSTPLVSKWVKLSDLINWIEELREKSDSPQKQILLLYIESELKKRS